MNVSILTRLTSRHLDDAAFAELWTNAAAEQTEIALHPHFDTCAECRVRFAAFTHWMETVRADGIAEADQAFSPDRLKTQQANILRRLEAAEQPTRIIAFPRSAVQASRPSHMRRWVTTAAAAGLIAGLALGQLMDLRHMSSGVSVEPVERTAEAPRSKPAPVILPAAFNEEAALAELEDAAMPRYEALRAYDTFTPRAADFIQPR